MSLEQAMASYLAELAERGQSERTLVMNGQWLPRFLAYCHQADVTDVRALTSELLNRFRRHTTWTPGVKGKLYSQNTLFLCLRLVRSFIRWLHSRDHLLSDVTESWVLPRPPVTFKRIPTVEEMFRILLTPDETTPLGLRNRAILELLYGTGIRAEECRFIKLEHLDLARSRLQVVNGKGQKSRLLPLGGRLKNTLNRYLEIRPHLARPEEQTLFVGRSGDGISKNIVGIVVRTSAKAAGCGTLGPHSLRHAFASHLLENGADLAIIGTLLGHKNLNSTHIYTQLTIQELKRVYRRTHPRAVRSQKGP